MALNGPGEEWILPNSSRTVVFDLPGCSVVNSHFLLWLQQFPLELSLEVVPSATDVCAPGPWKTPDGTDQALSTSFELSDCEIKADLLILDSGIVESVSKALAAGTPLNMPLRLWSQAMCGWELQPEHHAVVFTPQGCVRHLSTYQGKGC